jgi:protein-S-isoprenylcysteine O-methyltransferase Ste14
MHPALLACAWLWAAWAFIWVVTAQFTLKMKKNETVARLQHTVPTFIGLVTVFHNGQVPEIALGQAYDSDILRWMGVAVTILGHAFSIWARKHLGKYWSGTVALKHGHKIIDTGPYALVRHPIYTGLLLASFGSAMAAGTCEAFIGVAIMIPAYWIKWRREEKIMTQEFGAQYTAYMARTKAIIPYVI